MLPVGKKSGVFSSTPAQPYLPAMAAHFRKINAGNRIEIHHNSVSLPLSRSIANRLYLTLCEIRINEVKYLPLRVTDIRISTASELMTTETELTQEELERYARHLSLPSFGIEAQRRLKESSVLCIGAGGLGSPSTMYLAAAGVGRIGIVDPDTVDASNLQRQLLHGTLDVGRKKIQSAKETLNTINPNVHIELHEDRFEPGNAMALSSNYDLLIDGSDNFPTRYLSNDVSVLLGIPNVHGSIFRFEGQVSVFAPHLGAPCYRCLFPDAPDQGAVPD